VVTAGPTEKEIAAYRWVDDLRSPTGWLPVHWDQLRAQWSVSSMGKPLPFTFLAHTQWLRWRIERGFSDTDARSSHPRLSASTHRLSLPGAWARLPPSVPLWGTISASRGLSAAVGAGTAA